MALGMHADVCSPALNQPCAITSQIQPFEPRRSDREEIHPPKAVNLYQSESPLRSSPEPNADQNHTSRVHFEAEENEYSSEPLRTIASPAITYLNLGTASNQPQSVAVCPQRKCVAFGYRNGIELHWNDSITGNGLRRWFPLAAPSDYLYFLPQRPGVDSPRKLRLVSSAAGPLQRCRTRHNSAPTKMNFRSTNRSQGRMKSMTRLFFGSLPFPSSLESSSGTFADDPSERQGILRTVDCDHYYAVPLSDGTHMLFTDPSTGLLCLGSDAPLGGPTKLLRKACMMPPESSSAVTCYTTGHDLRWGVRIAAAYSDGAVVIYNLSTDIFERLRYMRSSPNIWDELGGVLGQSDILMDVAMTEESSSANEDFDPNQLNWRSFKCLQIHGNIIWRADAEVDSLQVECSGGGVKVWIFQRDGKAVRLSIYTARHHTPKRLHVGVDGRLQRA